MQHNSKASYLSEEGVAAVQAQAQKPTTLTDPKKEAARNKTGRYCSYYRFILINTFNPSKNYLC